MVKVIVIIIITHYLMIAGFTSRILLKGNYYQFATFAEIAQKTHSRFQKKFAENSTNFKIHIDAVSKIYAANAKPVTTKTFVHPYDSPHHPINVSWVKSVELQHDFLGPEIVSPHYENFLVSRKAAVTFWVGTAAMIFIMQSGDIHWMAQSLIYPWTFYFCYLYFWMEGKKSILKPYLARFYRRIYMLEAKNMNSYFAENAEASVRSLMAIAKQQLSYKTIHSQYTQIRNDSIVNFLVNEQVALKNHIDNRALNILKQAEATEELNQKKIINKVVEDAVTSLDKAYSQNKAKIQADIFELALEGLRKGQMDYSKDPILPYILQNIQKTVEGFQNLSKADQDKLVKLTEEQIQSIKNSDIRARDEFLKAEPKIDGTLKTNETVAKILANWSK